MKTMRKRKNGGRVKMREGLRRKEGRAAHSIDSRAIRAIVRESAGRGGARHH